MADSTLALPVVWRPRRTRIVAYTTAGVIMLGMIVLAVVVPGFKIFDRTMMVLVGLGLVWLLHMFARCRVIATPTGLTVVNAFRTHRYEWPQVLRVTMTEGEPWPTLDLADGTSIGAMGINGAEKPLAAHQLTQLHTLLHQHGEAADR